MKWEKKAIILRVVTAIVALFGLLVSSGFAAEDPDKFPTRPITMIVQWAAGGSSDLTARKLAELGGNMLGQRIVVENKLGGGGVVGTAVVSKAAPDGYTIGAITSSSITTIPHLRAVPYNPKEDFSWLMQYCNITFIFTVKAESSYKTFKEFVEEARRNPGKLNYSSPGPMSSTHIFMEQLFASEKVKVNHVPVGGGAEVVPQLLGGHLDGAIVTETLPLLKAGKFRGLAINAQKRIDLFPEVPTFNELGYRRFIPTWYGLYTPRGVHPVIFKKLYDAFKKGYEDPSFKDLLARLYLIPVFNDSESFSKIVLTDYESQARDLKELGLVK